MMKQIWIPAFALLFFTSCEGTKTDNNTMEKGVGIDISNMDLDVDPANNFYDYANGGWMENTTIPDDESRWGSFNELREMNDSMTLALVDKALAMESIDMNSDKGKVVAMFKSAMDTVKLNKEGIQPIEAMLHEIDSMQTKEDLLNWMIETEPYMGSLFGSYVQSDAKNSNYNALYLGGGSLGLPERSYYVEDDADSKEKRKKYVEHVARMLQFIGVSADEATEKANHILAFETRMAQARLTKEERRMPENTYNPKSMEELNTLAPNVNWNRYFEGIGAKNFEQVIVSQPKYIAEVSEIFGDTQITTIKEYLKWTVLNDAAPYLSEEIEKANFDFYGKTLRDLQEMKPRNERALQAVNRTLGEALGKLYVDEYFPKEAKETAVKMVEYVRSAFENRINDLEWMTDSTKTQAIEKLNGMRVKIGYPDKWKDYSKLEMGDSYYQNILNSRTWNFEKDIVKIGEEVDKDEWFMNPQTVNAYFNPLYNEIVFPAAILQPPFFDYQADMAVNFGGMGAVIGHEISHGFDDQGAKFDVDGNLNNWWTESDKENFEKRGKELVAQYDAYEPLEGVFVNGTFTLGENIGDLGGVNAAFDGLQLYLEDNGRPEDINGLTPEQRFFINWATVWRTKIRDEALKSQIKTDPHSPGMYRAVGPLVNVDDFYEAFDITAEDSMFVAPEDRVIIW